MIIPRMAFIKKLEFHQYNGSNSLEKEVPNDIPIIPATQLSLTLVLSYALAILSASPEHVS